MNEKLKTLATKEEIKTLATKTELKVEQDKIGKLGTHDSSYFVDKNDFGNDDFQNMFVYQPGFITFELKKRQEHWLCSQLEVRGSTYF